MTHVSINFDNVLKSGNNELVSALIPIVIKEISGNSAVKLYKQLNKLYNNDNEEINKYKTQLLNKAIKSIKSYGHYDNYNYSWFMGKIKGDSEEIAIKRLILLDVLNNYKKIGSWDKSYWYKQIVNIVNSEDEIIKLLNAFHEYIPVNELHKQLSKIDSGFNNIKLSFRNKSKFKFLTYTSKDFKNQKNKLKVISLITKQTNLLNYLPCEIIINKNDIETMPPVARLNFLEWYYEDHIKVTANKSFKSIKDLRNQISYRRKNNKKSKIKLLKNLNSDDMSKMLFSTAIKKHERVSKFINNFKEYEKMFDKNIVFVNTSKWD